MSLIANSAGINSDAFKDALINKIHYHEKLAKLSKINSI